MSDTVTDTTPGTASATPPAPEPQAAPAAQFTQEDINRFLADEKRKWKQQQDSVAQRARQEAEDAARTQQGQFEALANERQQRIESLSTQVETQTAQLAALHEEMERQIRARVRALPEELRDLDPGGDVPARFAWLAKAETAALKLSAQRTPGTPTGPRGTGAAPLGSADAADLMERKRRSGLYNL